MSRSKDLRNPFIVGEYVTGPFFADRKKEQDELIKELKGGSRIFLVSPRKYGKTSLLRQVEAQLRKEQYLCAFVDFFYIDSLNQFFSIVVREIFANSGLLFEQILNAVKELLPKLSPKITVEESGYSFSINKTSGSEDVLMKLDEVMDLPERLARKKKSRFIIFFDEFQEITRLTKDHLSVEKRLRATIQKQKNVSYVFAGSKQHLLEPMLLDEARPFYRMGQLKCLDLIPTKEYEPFIRKKFRQIGSDVARDSMSAIMEAAGSVPHFVQLVCHKLWLSKSGSKTRHISIDDVRSVVDGVIAENTPLFVSIWDQLTSNQRKTLRAVVSRASPQLMSSETARMFDLESPSSIQTAMKALMNKGLLKKTSRGYQLEDVFFAEWIARHFALWG